MKIALILAVSLSLVNGDGCLTKRQKAIEHLKQYIKKMNKTSSAFDQDGAELWRRMHDYENEGVICSSSMIYYGDLNNGKLEGNPKELAVEVLKELRVYEAIKQMHAYIDENVESVKDHDGARLKTMVAKFYRNRAIDCGLFYDYETFWRTPYINERLVDFAVKIFFDLVERISRIKQIPYELSDHFERLTITRTRDWEPIQQIIEYQEKLTLDGDRGGAQFLKLLDKFKENGALTDSEYNKIERKWKLLKDPSLLVADIEIILREKRVLECEDNNGAADAANYDHTIKKLQEYTKRVVHHDDELLRIISDFQDTDLLTKEKILGCLPLLTEKVCRNRKKLAELLLSDFRGYKAIAELFAYQKKNPNNEDRDGAQLWKYLDEYKKDGFVSTDDYKGYERLQKVANITPFQLATHVELDIGEKIDLECEINTGNDDGNAKLEYYHKAIKTIKEYIKKMKESCSTFDHRGSDLMQLMNLIQTQGMPHRVFCARQLTNYKSMLNDGLNPIKLAERVLKDLRLGVACLRLKAYRDKNDIDILDKDGAKFWKLIGEFYEEGLVSKKAYKRYKSGWKGNAILNDPEILANMVLIDLEGELIFCKKNKDRLAKNQQLAIKDLVEFIEGVSHNDVELYNMLRHFRNLGVLYRGEFNNYQSWWSDELIRQPKRLAQIVLRDIRLDVAIAELEEFIRKYDITGDQLPARKELWEFLDKFKKTDVISAQEYKKYQVKSKDVEVKDSTGFLAATVLTDLRKKEKENGKKSWNVIT